ncbi:Uncharacterised protein [Vibrio cholerae]|nr:Uncharacterised protein [Vibrio cholerae]CSI75487.1 Uncharacterised protein [Vibrio cholerae]
MPNHNHAPCRHQFPNAAALHHPLVPPPKSRSPLHAVKRLLSHQYCRENQAQTDADRVCFPIHLLSPLA